MWGRFLSRRGLRGGGTGMVERLAFHRPVERHKEEKRRKNSEMDFLLFRLVV